MIVGRKQDDPQSDSLRSFANARKVSGMTQRELSAKTGIAQGNISILESGNANPSLKTLKRLADAMGMEVEVVFTPAKS